MNEILLARCALLIGRCVSEPSFSPALSRVVDSLEPSLESSVRAAIDLLGKTAERARQIESAEQITAEIEGRSESEKVERMIYRILTEAAK